MAMNPGFLRSIWIEPTQNLFIQMFRYGFVGGIAFVADSGVLYILEHLFFHYLIAGIFGFLVGLTVNYFLSKAFVFAKEKAPVGHRVEFLTYGIIGLMGLGLTELLMYLFTEYGALHFMFSKAIAAALVLVWNFTARKMLLYRRSAHE